MVKNIKLLYLFFRNKTRSEFTEIKTWSESEGNLQMNMPDYSRSSLRNIKDGPQQ